MRTRIAFKNGVMLVLLFAGAALILLPFFWMLSLSLKPADEIFAPNIDFFPSRLEWRNYAKAFQEVPLLRFLMNGVIVCGSPFVCSIPLFDGRLLSQASLFGRSNSRASALRGRQPPP